MAHFSLWPLLTVDATLPDPVKVQCVQDYPTPKTVRQVQSFLGLTNYNRIFIPQFSKIALPINKLLQKGKKFDWDTACNDTFKILKEILLSRTVLVYPAWEEPFILTTDASNEAFGAILSQGMVDSGRPISFASRTLNKAEKNYSTTEKELLAIVWSVKNYRPHLLSRGFTVYTDHKPLKGITKSKDPSSRILRFLYKLSEYQFKIEYKAGKHNSNADALSGIPKINKLENLIKPVKGNDSTHSQLNQKMPTWLQYSRQG